MKTASSLRKGFEYQDRYCTLQLLDLIEDGNLAVQFQIESDEVLHVDDFVVRTPGKAPQGHQVKYHTTQEHAETFETLSKQASNTQRSLLQKVYKGWKQLSDGGEHPCIVRFISSNPAERGRYKLGSAIDTASGRIADKFFTSNDYRKARTVWSSHLGIDEGRLRRFLRDIVWKLGYESLDGLRRLIQRQLERLKFPHDETAVRELAEVVVHYATSVTTNKSVQDFLETLWKSTKFREACEQRFSSLSWGAGEKRRAAKVKVIVLRLMTLPAFVGDRYACLEEPSPLEDYMGGTTVGEVAPAFADLHKQWREEYLRWHRLRVLGLLNAIKEFQPDCVV